MERNMLCDRVMLNEPLLTDRVAQAILQEDRELNGPGRSDGRDHNAQFRVLVAVADEAAAGAVGGWLSGAGYDVTVVRSGAEAKGSSGSFQCGVFDMQLPDESGIVLAASLSTDDKLETVVFRPEDCLPAPQGTDDDGLNCTGQLMDLESRVAAAVAETAASAQAA